MSPAVHGVVGRRLLVNYRVELEKLDTVLSEPFRGREVGETGKGIGSICLTRVENARPRFAPEFFGVSAETATHRVYARVERSGDHCIYVPRRDVSSRFHALLFGSLLPTEFEQGEFQEMENGRKHQIRVECGKEIVGVEFHETERDGVGDDSVFYSIESASTFLCDAGTEYDLTGDVYSGVETVPQERGLEPVEVDEVRSSFFEKLGGKFDSAFRAENVEHVWKPRRSGT